MHFDELDDREKTWVVEHERLWRMAHAIVGAQPALDVSLVFHTLVNLRRSPEERLARGLTRGAPAAE